MKLVPFTEAEFPYLECLIPYQPLAMKTVYCPIDTSLNFHQANKLIKDLKPRLLVTQEEYLSPPANNPHRTEFTIDYNNIEKISVGSVLNIKVRNTFACGKMDPRLAKDMEPYFKDDKHAAAATVTATIDNMNNKYRLLKVLQVLHDIRSNCIYISIFYL